jgi:NhaP-type Na+/H+ or K+/H+ antiporter
MPTVSIVNFNIVCAALGAFIVLFGLVSFLLKEKFYLSETRTFIAIQRIISIKLTIATVLATVAGAIFSPGAANIIRPLEYALEDEEVLATITLYFSRLVLGIQLVIAGVQLPSKYLKTEWRSLAYLLGPGMVAMWLCTSLLVWAMVPHITILYALAVGACVTPTDPVLANNIVKGKFADQNIPTELQRIIIAESGANDGLGFPFLFLPLYLIQFSLEGGRGSHGNVGTAFAMWIYDIWIYQILLGVVYGAVVGWIAKELLHWAEKRKYVDRESFIVFAVALAVSREA